MMVFHPHLWKPPNQNPPISPCNMVLGNMSTQYMLLLLNSCTVNSIRNVWLKTTSIASTRIEKNCWSFRTEFTCVLTCVNLSRAPKVGEYHCHPPDPQILASLAKSNSATPTGWLS